MPARRRRIGKGHPEHRLLPQQGQEHQNCCRLLAEQYGGQVPQYLEQLVELPGIGRKTANVVLGTAFGIAAGVVVDTHVTRLSGRMGLTQQKDPAKIEQDLMAVLPEKEWVAFSHRMIQHGRKVCMARKPKCGDAVPARAWFARKIGVRGVPPWCYPATKSASSWARTSSSTRSMKAGSIPTATISRCTTN